MINKINIFKIKRRYFLMTASSFTASLLFSSCNSSQSEAPSNTTNVAENTARSPQQKETVKVGVWAVISEDILKFVKDNLAADAGLDLQIVKFNDWIQPNTALKDGEIDANYFQHNPFMKTAAKELNLNLVMLSQGFLTPMGIYSRRFKSLNEIPANASIAIYNDTSNGDRCLRLLATHGLIQLKDNLGDLADVKDIAKNSKNLRFKQLEGPAVVRSLDDVDLAVFSSGLRLQARLQIQPLVQETVAEKRYAVGLVTLKDKEKEPKIQKLNQLVTDSRVKDFIDRKYQGGVLAVF